MLQLHPLLRMDALFAQHERSLLCFLDGAAESAVKPVLITKAEPGSKPLPVSAEATLYASLPASDPGMLVLKWAFASHFPKAWEVQ